MHFTKILTKKKSNLEADTQINGETNFNKI